MNNFPDSIKKLIDKFTQLPGIGPKAAERIVFYLQKKDNNFSNDFSNLLNNLKKDIINCSICFNVTINDPCNICSDTSRDKNTICVVADPQDINVIEKTNDYQGLYHVLHGTLNPAEQITPEKLKIKELIDRIKNNGIKEVIIATNPDLEGESTALYLARSLKNFNVKTTRLAKGLPMGSTIEYADEITISNALKGRQEL